MTKRHSRKEQRQSRYMRSEYYHHRGTPSRSRSHVCVCVCVFYIAYVPSYVYVLISHVCMYVYTMRRPVGGVYPFIPFFALSFICAPENSVADNETENGEKIQSAARNTSIGTRVGNRCKRKTMIRQREARREDMRQANGGVGLAIRKSRPSIVNHVSVLLARKSRREHNFSMSHACADGMDGFAALTNSPSCTVAPANAVCERGPRR